MAVPSVSRCVSRARGVEGLEAAGRLQQQRHRVATLMAGQGDLRPQPHHAGPVEVVERAEVHGGDQRRGAVG